MSIKCSECTRENLTEDDFYKIKKTGYLYKYCNYCRKDKEQKRKASYVNEQIFIKEKTCNRCKKLKNNSEFNKKSDSPDKMQHICKECESDLKKEAYAKNNNKG